jgi:hypothetical protein
MAHAQDYPALNGLNALSLEPSTCALMANVLRIQTNALITQQVVHSTFLSNAPIQANVSMILSSVKTRQTWNKLWNTARTISIWHSAVKTMEDVLILKKNARMQFLNQAV